MHRGHNEAREFPNASLTVPTNLSSASLSRDASFLTGSIRRYSRRFNSAEEIYKETRIWIWIEINASIFFVVLLSRDERDWDFTLIKLGRKRKKDWKCIDVQMSVFFISENIDGCFSNLLKYSININVKYLLNINNINFFIK